MASLGIEKGFATQVIGDRIPEAFSNDLTWVLNRKFNFQILIPVGIDFQLALPDPLRVIFIDVLDFKFMSNVEFFQSCQD